jgi:hypothetical protein
LTDLHVFYKTGVDDFNDEKEWPMYHDDDVDSSDSEDFFPPDIIITGGEYNRSPSRNLHRVRSQLQSETAEARSSRAEQNSFGPSEHTLKEYVIRI